MSVIFEDFFLTNGAPWGAVAAAPTVTSLSTSSGPTTGQVVTINGTNLDGVQSVSIGAVQVPVVTITATALTVSIPALATGSYTIAVTTGGGIATIAYTVRATIFWSTGVEGGALGVANANSALFTAVGPNTTVVTNPNTRPGGVGTYCVRLAPAASLAYVQNFNQAGWPTVRQRVLRMYVMATVIPAVRSPFLEQGAPTNGCKFYFSTTGVELRFGNGGTTQNFTVGGLPTIFLPNVWYCLDIYFDYSGANKIAKVQVDGVDQVSSVSGTTTFSGIIEAAGDMSYLTWGAPDASTYTLHMDDFAVSHLPGDYPLGPTAGSKIMLPIDLDALGAGTSFFIQPGSVALTTSNDSTVGLAAIDDAPPLTSTTDWIEQSTTGTLPSVDVKFAAPPTDATAVRLVTGVTASTAAQATSVTATAVVSGPGSGTTLYQNLNIASTSLLEAGNQVNPPPGGWSNPYINGIYVTWGKAGSVAAIPQLHHAYIEYEAPVYTTPSSFAAFGIPL